MNSILNLYKPTGISSTHLLNQLKKKIQEKKIGHTGTLDPLAEGVLPVFTGKMTKLIPFFNSSDKTYFVVAKLGFASSTYDSEGELTQIDLPKNSPSLLTKTLLQFSGEIEQVPPIYSAISVNGKRLYEYARQGIEVERPTRKITIYSLTNIYINFPYVSFHVHCSKGTYIRSLVHDFGKALGSAAYIIQLVRTSASPFFTLQNTISLDQIDKINKNRILFHQIKDVFPSWFSLQLESQEQKEKLKNGQTILFNNTQNIKLFPNKNTYAYITGANQELYSIGLLAFSQDYRLSFTPKKVCL